MKVRIVIICNLDEICILTRFVGEYADAMLPSGLHHLAPCNYKPLQAILARSYSRGPEYAEQNVPNWNIMCLDYCHKYYNGIYRCYISSTTTDSMKCSWQRCGHRSFCTRYKTVVKYFHCNNIQLNVTVRSLQSPPVVRKRPFDTLPPLLKPRILISIE